MLRSRMWVVAFIAVQVLVPALGLAARFVWDGWHVRTLLPFSWQMFSAVS